MNRRHWSSCAAPIAAKQWNQNLEKSISFFHILFSEQICQKNSIQFKLICIKSKFGKYNLLLASLNKFAKKINPISICRKDCESCRMLAARRIRWLWKGDGLWCGLMNESYRLWTESVARERWWLEDGNAPRTPTSWRDRRLRKGGVMKMGHEWVVDKVFQSNCFYLLTQKNSLTHIKIWTIWLN